MNDFLELRKVSKKFGEFSALKGIDISIREGEFISFLGGSGCGKTTTLRIIAGFETMSSGSLLLDGADLTLIPPEKRNFGFVFQQYALFPNMTVRGNISFALKRQGRSRREIARIADEALDMVRMRDFADRWPHELSGGQQQRVALARAIARKPRLLLLDEPLSALDAKIRAHLREEIRSIQQELNITALYVTHDQEEAMALSDRIVLMNEGKIEQTGTPEQLYFEPATDFSASFIGNTNKLKATVIDPERGIVDIAGQKINLNRKIQSEAGTGGFISVRPEHLDFISSASENHQNHSILNGTVVSRRFLGAVLRTVVAIDGNETILVDTFNTRNRFLPDAGEAVTIRFSAENAAVI